MTQPWPVKVRHEIHILTCKNNRFHVAVLQLIYGCQDATWGPWATGRHLGLIDGHMLLAEYKLELQNAT